MKMLINKITYMLIKSSGQNNKIYQRPGLRIEQCMYLNPCELQVRFIIYLK